MQGKEISELVSAMSSGVPYVNVTTQGKPWRNSRTELTFKVLGADYDDIPSVVELVWFLLICR